MRVGTIVFAGSVVRKTYPWGELGHRVQRVRNYVGSDDWVVALFPRLFELPLFNRIGNDLGSAGFAGFDLPTSQPSTPEVRNINVHGGHGAFRHETIPEIVNYMFNRSQSDRASERSRDRGFVGHVVSSPLTVLLVWTFLAITLAFVAVRVVAAAATPASPVLLLFLLLVVRTLQTV